MEDLGVVVAIGLTIEVTRLMMILVLGPLGLRLGAVARHRMMAIPKSRKDDSFHTRSQCYSQITRYFLSERQRPHEQDQAMV